MLGGKCRVGGSEADFLLFYLNRRKMVLIVTLTSKVTQNSGVIAYLIKRGRDRDDRFENPCKRKWN